MVSKKNVSREAYLVKCCRVALYASRFTLHLFVLLFLFTGCATSFDSKGIYHKVRKGENLFWIARSYGVELQDLAEINNLKDAEPKLTVGERLYIPPKRYSRYKKLPFEEELARHVSRKPLKREKQTAMTAVVRPKIPKVYTDPNRFIWPVRGRVFSPFGVRHGRRHDGIDIQAPIGTPVMAAGNGKVVFAGSMRGYGNLILVRHKKNFFTAYAHNKLNKVQAGQKVKQGQIISLSGRTGRATGPHVHFEVREGIKPRNPLFFLPVLKESSVVGRRSSAKSVK